MDILLEAIAEFLNVATPRADSVRAKARDELRKKPPVAPSP